MYTLTFTVTNDLNYDQRMIRICESLAANDYQVELIGRKLKYSTPLTSRSFFQHRLNCFFTKGFLFYAEFNLRLLIYLLGRKSDLYCAIDLDTIIPCLLVSKIKGKKRVYDAHELFCEMKEVVTRPHVRALWQVIEKWCVPQYQYGYTVSKPIADVFRDVYNVRYAVIRNIAKYQISRTDINRKQVIIYQGAVNEGRSFETLIPAMQQVKAQLSIYGDGNFYEQVKDLIETHQLQHKVFLKGKSLPEELRAVTSNALIGITLFENNGLSNYYSLANRFFDYIHAEVPQLCVDYPAYTEINNEWEVAVLISDLSPANIASQLNNLIDDTVLYERLRRNCKLAAQQLNWQEEEKKLLEFYKKIMA